MYISDTTTRQFFIFLEKRGSDDKHHFLGVPSHDPLKSAGRTQLYLYHIFQLIAIPYSMLPGVEKGIFLFKKICMIEELLPVVIN